MLARPLSHYSIQHHGHFGMIFPLLGATRTLMRGILERLSIIFNEGKASPTDVDSNGSTLFQVNYRLLVPLYMKAAYRPLGCCK